MFYFFAIGHKCTEREREREKRERRERERERESAQKLQIDKADRQTDRGMAQLLSYEYFLCS